MKWIRRAGRWILFAIVFALCAAMFYLIAIMGDGDADSAAQSAPALAPAAAMENGAATFAADALESAKRCSQAPVMTLASGWYLTGGEARQWTERGKTMREIAAIEEASFQSVSESIEAGRKKFLKIFRQTP